MTTPIDPDLSMAENAENILEHSNNLALKKLAKKYLNNLESLEEIYDAERESLAHAFKNEAEAAAFSAKRPFDPVLADLCRKARQTIYAYWSWRDGSQPDQTPPEDDEIRQILSHLDEAINALRS